MIAETGACRIEVMSSTSSSRGQVSTRQVSTRQVGTRQVRRGTQGGVAHHNVTSSQGAAAAAPARQTAVRSRPFKRRSYHLLTRGTLTIHTVNRFSELTSHSLHL